MVQVNITHESGSLVVEVENPENRESVVLAYAQAYDIGVDSAANTLQHHEMTYSNGQWVFHPKAVYGE